MTATLQVMSHSFYSCRIVCKHVYTINKGLLPNETDMTNGLKKKFSHMLTCQPGFPPMLRTAWWGHAPRWCLPLCRERWASGPWQPSHLCQKIACYKETLLFSGHKQNESALPFFRLCSTQSHWHHCLKTFTLFIIWFKRRTIAVPDTFNKDISKMSLEDCVNQTGLFCALPSPKNVLSRKFIPITS